MTRRERLERKVEKRREWADKRRAKASERFSTASRLVADIPMGQPILIGHHSEKHHRATLARSDSAMRAGCESADMAQHHDSKADGLESQLDSSIFSDDTDAVEQLEKRIAEREAKRDRMKAINLAHRRFLKNPASLDSADFTDAEKHLIRTYKPAYSWEPNPHPPYSFQNLGGNIRRDQQRLKQIKAQQERQADAEQAGGIVISEGNGWARITFAEKPAREILNELKAAGFRWGAGCWSGKADSIPASVRELASAATVGE